MREIASQDKIQKFMKAFGALAPREARVYFTGGATAVLMGWRAASIDINIRFDPEMDELYRGLPALKEQLQINIELASPSDFIPPLPGWAERCEFIGQEGKVSFYHYDLYSQALSKIERGHTQDLQDVKDMIQRGLLKLDKLQSFYDAIEPNLYRYPAINPETFSKAVKQAIQK